MQAIEAVSNILAQRTWLRRLLRGLGILLAIALLLAAISWLALPHFVKKIALEQIQEQTGRTAAIGQVSFNPLILKLSVADVTLFEPDQITPALSIKTLVINASSASLLRRALVLDGAQLIEPRLHLIRTSAAGIGRYNFSDVIDRIMAKPDSPEKTKFALSDLQLQNGSILFDDQVSTKRIDIQALNLGLPFISNFPADTNNDVQPHASAIINGSKFALHGRSKPFANSLETALALDLEQVDLASYVPFLPMKLPLTLHSAKLSSKLDVRFTHAPNKILLSGTLRLDDLQLRDNNAAPLLNSRSVQLNIAQINLLTGATAINQLHIDTPQVWASLDRKNILNWARLLNTSDSKAAKKPAAPEVKPTLSLQHLSIINGSVNWADDYHAAPRQNAQLNAIGLDLQQLSTASDAPPAHFTLSATEASGGSLKVDGQINPSSAALKADVNLDALPLAHYQAYLNRALAAQISGQLSLRSSVEIAAGQLKLSQFNLDLNALKLRAKNSGSVTVKSIALSDATLDTSSQQFQAAALRISGLRGDVQRDAKGRLPQYTLPTTSTAPAAKSTPWQARLTEFALSDSSVIYQDNSVAPALKLQADHLNVNLKNISSQLDQVLSIALQTKLNKSGSLQLSGVAATQLKSITLNVNAQRIPLAALQPYFDEYVNVTLRNGIVSAKGKLSVTPPLKQQTLAVHYNGNAQLNNFDVLDKDSNSDFLRWKTLTLNAIDATIGNSAPLITIGKIGLDRFYARAILAPDGKLNLQNIMVTQPPANTAVGASSSAAATATAATTPTPAPAVIRIKQIALSGGNINFTDNFVKPNYSANMTGMNGSIGAIASDRAQPAAIDIKGKIDDDAQLLISGALNPLFKPMFLDIKASANNVELTRMTPYAAKYAGYPIIKGKLSMDIAYKIENQALMAQNDIRIDQLTFGERVDSPDATKLPVMLAIALLKDRHGQINVNLPISGSLSDPKFSIGGIIVRIFVNLIVKAVTSPFALLSSAFGGDSATLSYLEFVPGFAVLSSSAEQKLDTLSKALLDRPALKLDIIGRADPIADSNGLRRAALDDKIKDLKRRDGQIEGPITLDDNDRAKYLAAVYKNEKFNKPKNIIGFAKSLPPDEMERLILENTTVGPEQLRQLALQRAEVARHYLEETGKIPLERIYLVAPKLTADGISDKGAASRVDFALK